MKKISSHKSGGLAFVLMTALFVASCSHNQMKEKPFGFIEGERHGKIWAIKNFNGKVAYRTESDCKPRSEALALMSVYFWPLSAPVYAFCTEYLVIDGWHKIPGKEIAGPYFLDNKLAYTVRKSAHVRELVWDGEAIFKGRELGIESEGDVGVVTVDGAHYVMSDDKIYGPYPKVINASMIDGKLFFSVTSSADFESSGYHFSGGDKLGVEYQKLDIASYAQYRDEIAFIGIKPDGMYVVCGEQEYGPYKMAYSLLSTEIGLAWIVREGVEEFVVVDGKPWERYDYYVNSENKIYTVSDKVLYQGVRKGKHYFVIDNDAVEYGNPKQVKRAIKKQLDPYLINQYKAGNQVKRYSNLLEIEGKRHSIPSHLFQGFLYISDDRNDMFTILKIGENYLWATQNNNGISIFYGGHEIGTYDSIGKFRNIGGRLVFAARKGKRAGLVIDGEEWLEYEMPEGEDIDREISRFNITDPYTPLDFDGRIVFMAYEDGKYFIVEEKEGKSVKRPENHVRIISL